MLSSSRRMSRRALACVLGSAASAAGVVSAAGPATAPADAPPVADAPVANTPAVTPPSSVVPADAATPGKADYAFTLSGIANYAADADLHGDGGSFSVFRSGGALAVEHPLPGRNTVRVSLDGEYSHYFFRGLSAVPGDDGHDSLDVYLLSVRPTFTHYFNDDLGVYGGVSVVAAGESDAHLDDALSYGGFAGVTYRLGTNVWVGVGVGFTTQLEDDAYVLPLLTVNWDITRQLNFSAEGLSAKLSYKVSDALSVYAQARYTYRQFRLSGDEVLANGVLNDQSVPLTVGLTYKVDDKLSISAEAGVVAYRRLEFRDDDDHQVGADEADPAAFAGLQVTYAF